MSHYIDYIMQNYGMMSEEENVNSSDSENSFSGGFFLSGGQRSNPELSGGKVSSEEISTPNGGFPNIILCKDDKEEVNPNEIQPAVTRREIAADKAILSISQILKSRRNI